MIAAHFAPGEEIRLRDPALPLEAIRKEHPVPPDTDLLRVLRQKVPEPESQPGVAPGREKRDEEQRGRNEQQLSPFFPAFRYKRQVIFHENSLSLSGQLFSEGEYYTIFRNLLQIFPVRKMSMHRKRPSLDGEKTWGERTIDNFLSIDVQRVALFK